ncbi:MAG: hypothetical protein JWN76_44 [Chitinophagaceae bacterium]|nr:hypothetical protein [Chitinophagaceae bacterium]
MGLKSFNLNVIEDLQEYGRKEQLQAVFAMFEKELQNGNVLLFQRRFMNAEAESIIEIKTIEEFLLFSKRFLPVYQ